MTGPSKRIATRAVISMTLTALLTGCAVGNQASGTPVARISRSHASRCTGGPCASQVTHGAPADPSHIIARDVEALRRNSYTVDRHITGIMPDGTMLIIFHSVCTGSADGHCQSIDVFRNEQRKGILHRQYVGVLQLRTRRDGFTVKAVNYGQQDPLCCPSLPPVSDTYTWTGHGFHESGPLPGSPGG